MSSAQTRARASRLAERAKHGGLVECKGSGSAVDADGVTGAAGEHWRGPCSVCGTRVALALGLSGPHYGAVAVNHYAKPRPKGGTS